MKKYLLTLFAASIILIASSFATAQDNGSSTQQAPPSAQNNNGPGNGGRHHGPPDPAERTQHLTKKLKLTSDQQTKVMSILQNEHAQMETLHSDSTMSQDDRRAKMMDMHKNTDAEIRAVLDSSQQAKWDAMQSQRQQWGEGHGQGAPNNGGEQAPPPQQ